MFNKARIKLTVYYLLIIMVISIFFSIGIYRILTGELDRVEKLQRIRIERQYPQGRFSFTPPFIDPEIIVETKNRIKIILVGIDIFIVGVSSIAGYFLAGRTLKPIKEMVDEQNRFIADASHELRTPLTSLKTEIEVNLRDKKLRLSEAKKILTSNLEEVNDLQTLSDSLIKLTQYQKGDNGLVFSKISSSETISEAVKKVAAFAKSKQIEIIKKTEEVVFNGNKQALVETMVIFLENAVKYSPNESKVGISANRNDGNIMIEIRDEGIGIDEKDLPHIFDRFYRSDKSRNKIEASGYGLGLSIAKQIIEKHCGSIEVKSEVGKGSVFTIKLPIKHA